MRFAESTRESSCTSTLPRQLERVRLHLLTYLCTADDSFAVDIDVDAMNIDLMSISAHKIYGPKGIGACYIRRRPRVRIEPLFSGGGQERGLRSGTVPAPLAVGFGEACKIAKREMAVSHRFTTLRVGPGEGDGWTTMFRR